MNKKHPPSACRIELHGDLLEDLDPASALLTWVDAHSREKTQNVLTPQFALRDSDVNPYHRQIANVTLRRER
jgi:hypothetical protein